MKKYNDQVIEIIRRHFFPGRQSEPDGKRTDMGQQFFLLMKMARRFWPEDFEALWAGITDNERVEYFHKGFRQVDVFESARELDGIIYINIAQWDQEWIPFQAMMKDIIRLNEGKE